MSEYDLHIDIVGDDSSFSQTLLNVRDGMKKTKQVIEQTGMSVDQFFKKVRDNERMLESVSVKIDLSNPTGELKKFDEQVVLMCENLDKYFEGLKGKLDAMAKALGDGSTIAGNIKTNEDNIAQIRELQRANAELTAEIQRQRAAYEEQQSQLRKIADAVRQNNIPAIQQMGEQMDEASKRIKTDEIRNSLKELSKESDEMARRMAKAVGDVEAYNSILDDLWKKIEAGDKSVSMKDIDEVEAKWGKAVKELEAAKKEYNELTDEQKKYVDELSNINGHHVRMRTQIMNVREELMQMIAAGRQGTPEFQQLAEQAGQLRRQMTLASATMQYFADPNKNLTTLKVGLQGVAGAAGLVTGVMGLFNSENEKLAQIQAKVQSVLAVLVGLETTYNLVKKTSNVMLAIEEVKTFALAKARGVQTAATTAATAAQEGLNTAMRANPIGAIISLLAILGTAIYAIVKALTSETDAEKKAREEKEAHIKAIKEQHEQWAKSVAESASKQLISYRELQKKWDELGDDLKAKERFIKDNQDAFKNLGFAVDSVSDAERLLVTNTDAVVAAMMSRAKAAAYASQMQKVYEEQLERELNKTVENGGKYYRLDKNENGKYSLGTDISQKGVVTREEMKSVGAYTYGGLPVITEEQVKEIIEIRKKGAKKIADQLRKESNDRLKFYEESAKKETDASKKALQASGIKAYDANAEKRNKEQEKARQDAEKNAKANAALRQKLYELEQKAEQEAAAQTESTIKAVNAAKIATIENAEERTRAQQDEQHRLNLEAIDRREEEMKKKLYEFNKSVWEAKNQGSGQSYSDTEEGKAGYVNLQLAKEQMDELQALRLKENAEYKRLVQKRYEDEAHAMLDYLKEYGTLQQKRLAIQQEYDDKIADETDKTQREILEAQKKQTIDAFDMEVLKAEIDWTTMFDGIGNALEEEMKATLDKVEKFIQSKSFRELDAKEKAEYVKMRNELVKKTGGGVGTFDFSIYHQIGEDMKAYQQAIRDAKIAQDNHTAAVNDFKEADAELKEAEKNLAKAMNNIASNPQAAEDANRIYLDAKGKQQMADMVAKITGKKQDEAEGNVIVAQGNLTNSTTQAQQAIDNFSSAIGQMTSGSLRGFADGLVNLIAAIGGNNGNGLSGLGKAGGIIGAILSIIDAIGSNEEGLSGVVAEIIDKIVNVITSLIDKITNGDFFRDINTAVGEGIQKILEHLFNSISDIISNHVEAWGDAFNGNFGSGFQEGFGVGGFFGKIFGERDGEKTYAEIQEEISDRIEEANKALDRLTEQLEKSYGIDAINKAEEAQKQLQKNQSDMIKGLDAALWDNYGGGESDYRKWNRFGRDEGIIANLMQKYRLKSSDMSWNALFNENSADEIARMLDDIRNTDFDLWSRFKSAGYNEGAVREWMEQLADTVKESDDIQKALEEKLTTTTKDNVIDDFKESLYDLADGSEDATEEIAENWQKMVNRMVVDNLIFGEDFQKRLSEWYQGLADLQNGRVTAAEYEKAKNDVWQQYWNGGIDVDELYRQLRILGMSFDMTDEEYAEMINEKIEEYKKIYGDAAEQVAYFEQLGIINAITGAENEEGKVQEYFSNLRDMWLTTLTDMQQDGESWKKEIQRVMFEDLVSSMVLGDDFTEWLENWKAAYKEALEAGDDARLTQLLEEQVAKREELAGKAQQIADGIGYEVDESLNAFSNIRSSLLDTLLDMDADADTWGRKIRETLLSEMVEKTIIESMGLGELMENFGKQLLGFLTNEKLTDTARQQSIDEVLKEMEESFGKASELVQKMRDALGIGKQEEEQVSVFSDLRKDFLDTLMDMEDDAVSFRTRLDNIMLRDLMEKQVLDVPFTINGMTFDDFDTYLEDWNKRYMDAVASGNQEIIDALLEELVQARSITIEAAQQLRERLNLNNAVKDTTFKDMADNWISTLMDMDATADDWAESVGSMMAQRIIEQMISAKMIQPLLDQLQDDFDKVMSEEGATWESAIAALSPEIEKLKDRFDELQPIVQQILNAFGIFKEDLDEIEEEVDTTFSSLTDSWISMLMDMEATADDWAKSVGRVMAQRIIEEMVAAKMLQPYIDALKSAFDGAIASGGTIDSVIAAVLPKINELKDQFGEIRPIVEAIMNAFGLIEEKVEDIEEEVGDTTFKGMASEWASALMDMEMTADDWAKNVGRIMAQRIIEEMLIPTLIQPLLDQMQVAFDAAMNMANATWQTAVAAMSPYLDQLKDVFNEVQPIAEQILNAFGIFREVKEEVVEEAKEGFSDLRGLFVSALMDMEADADKFGKDIARKMTEQMIDKLIEKQFGSQLDAINEAWYNALEAGDTAAMERIRQQLIELQKLCGEAVQPLLDTLAQIEYVPEVVEEEVDDTITSMRDDFLSALMDMRAGTKDFVTDIRTLLAQKLVEKFILNSQFDTWLNSIQQKYEAIMNSGKSEEEMAEAMQRLATEWGLQAKEMQEQTQHIFDITGLTDVLEQLNSPIADLRSTFRSALMDMTSDAQTFADNISQALTEAFIDRFVLGDEFDKRLEEWQEQYASIMRGNYTEEERAQLLNNLRQAITAAKEGYADEAKLIHELMGTTSYTDQKATMNMSDKATYDQFETYLGIAVAQQQATLQGNDVRQQILTVLQNMSGISTPKNDELESIRMLAVTRNEYLLDIKRTNRDILNLLGNEISGIKNELQRIF